MSTIHIRALEQLREQRWDHAHQTIQSFDDPLACLIHGHLHHIEGDLSNAAYWYHRGGEAVPADSMEKEFLRLFTLAQDS